MDKVLTSLKEWLKNILRNSWLLFAVVLILARFSHSFERQIRKYKESKRETWRRACSRPNCSVNRQIHYPRYHSREHRSRCQHQPVNLQERRCRQATAKRSSTAYWSDKKPARRGIFLHGHCTDDRNRSDSLKLLGQMDRLNAEIDAIRYHFGIFCARLCFNPGL